MESKGMMLPGRPTMCAPTKNIEQFGKPINGSLPTMCCTIMLKEEDAAEVIAKAKAFVEEVRKWLQKRDML